MLVPKKCERLHFFAWELRDVCAKIVVHKNELNSFAKKSCLLATSQPTHQPRALKSFCPAHWEVNSCLSIYLVYTIAVADAMANVIIGIERTERLNWQKNIILSFVRSEVAAAATTTRKWWSELGLDYGLSWCINSHQSQNILGGSNSSYSTSSADSLTHVCDCHWYTLYVTVCMHTCVCCLLLNHVDMKSKSSSGKWGGFFRETK